MKAASFSDTVKFLHNNNTH